MPDITSVMAISTPCTGGRIVISLQVQALPLLPNRVKYPLPTVQVENIFLSGSTVSQPSIVEYCLIGLFFSSSYLSFCPCFDVALTLFLIVLQCSTTSFPCYPLFYSVPVCSTIKRFHCYPLFYNSQIDSFKIDLYGSFREKASIWVETI